MTDPVGPPAGAPEDAVAGRVVRLLHVPVKSLPGVEVDALHLAAHGVVGDRRLLVLDERDRIVTQRQEPALARVSAAAEVDGEQVVALRLATGDGAGRAASGCADRAAAAAVAAGPVVADGPALRPRLFGRDRPCRVVGGDFAALLSDVTGRPLRLALLDGPGLGWDDGPLSLVGSATRRWAADALGEGGDDPRRWRMAVEVDGPAAHGEEQWGGREVRLGGSGDAAGGDGPVLRVLEPLGRCTVPSVDPDDGAPDRDAVRGLLALRERADLGVVAEVVRPGVVRLDDAVTLVDG